MLILNIPLIYQLQISSLISNTATVDLEKNTVKKCNHNKSTLLEVTSQAHTTK